MLFYLQNFFLVITFYTYHNTLSCLGFFIFFCILMFKETQKHLLLCVSSFLVRYLYQNTCTKLYDASFLLHRGMISAFCHLFFYQIVYRRKNKKSNFFPCFYSVDLERIGDITCDPTCDL